MTTHGPNDPGWPENNPGGSDSSQPPGRHGDYPGTPPGGPAPGSGSGYGQPIYGGQPSYGQGEQPSYGQGGQHAQASGYDQGYPPPSTPGIPPPNKNFFGALFDFGFNSFVTPSLVKIIYILGTVVIAIGVLAFIVSGFINGIGYGILALILAPIVGLIYLAFLRVTLELYYAVIRLSEDVHRRDGAM